MPPKGKRKRSSTGSITESEKKIRLENAKETAKRLREARANERIRELEINPPGSPIASEPDDDFFTHIELLDENLKHKYAEEPAIATAFSQMSTAYSNFSSDHRPKPLYTDSVVFSNEDDIELLGPFSTNTKNRDVGRRASAPSSLTPKPAETSRKPRMKKNGDTYKSIGLIVSEVKEMPASGAALQTSTETTPPINAVYSPPRQKVTEPLQWSIIQKLYLVLLTMVVMCVSVVAFEYFEENWLCIHQFLSIAFEQTKWGLTILCVLLILAVVASITCYIIQKRSNDKCRRAEVVAKVAATAKDILRNDHSGGPYPSLFIMEAIADYISSDSPVTESYSQYFLRKGTKLLNRDELVRAWNDVDMVVCTDTRVQATVQVYEGKQRRCWRFMTTAKSPGFVATGTTPLAN